ncbi:MAG: hypothetical protein K9J37_12350 [Saprospiraceae bacterium]|nr:hypothetical protein [Saprospiraceae bacterium]MCF8250701.1 hypothetical protein [Saprospiraceae bacterium]MCF8283148.1 hypothetical protein [Bacteroidales bacterium]MCF8312553.1 hypothetical protein [Saprospiraceae bacterium]MCF8440767.1 hypothetical protein [Saprospiraceae bacterium]
MKKTFFGFILVLTCQLLCTQPSSTMHIVEFEKKLDSLFEPFNALPCPTVLWNPTGQASSF